MLSESTGELILIASAVVGTVAVFYLVMMLRDLLILAAFQADERDFDNGVGVNEKTGRINQRGRCDNHRCQATQCKGAAKNRCTEGN